KAGVVKAVDGLTYDIHEGETIALVGESGCGKSVSALSLLRLVQDPPGKIVGGDVLWKDNDLLKLSDREIRNIRGKEIAMIFQEPTTSLNPVFTVGRQIMEALQLHRHLDRAAARRECINLFDRVGISDTERRIDQYPHQLSGGMRQRVMIAMALSCNPALLIADEPTTSLDVTTQAQILEIIDRLTKESGMSSILITHNLGLVAKYAQRVNVMYAGRIVEQASTKDIYNDPRHPYTIALLHSVPRLDQKRGERLVPISGEPPDLSRLPAGCAFQPRCVYATERCKQEVSLVTISTGRKVACWVDVKERHHAA
ncbi:MAG: ABC transporter ATP-binding protein, partial [Chloroflexota bacterium]